MPKAVSSESQSQIEAALWIMGSGVLFTAHVALSKLLSERYDPGLLAFFRASIGLVWTVPFLFQAGLAGFRTTRPGLLILRGVFGSIGFLLAFYAISDAFGASLSQVNAISFSRSLFVVVLAAFILKETVGPRRWMATFIGFTGVLVMVRPGADMELGSIFALGSAACFAVAITMVKLLSKDHSALTLLTYANLASLIMSVPFAIIHWKTPDNITDIVFIALMALAGVLTQTCYINGMSKGDASFLSTIDYLRLPLTASADWLIFQEFPGPYVWTGAAVIVTSTLYITFREAAANQTNS